MKNDFLQEIIDDCKKFSKNRKINCVFVEDLLLNIFVHTGVPAGSPITNADVNRLKLTLSELVDERVKNPVFETDWIKAEDVDVMIHPMCVDFMMGICCLNQILEDNKKIQALSDKDKTFYYTILLIMTYSDPFYHTLMAESKIKESKIFSIKRKFDISSYRIEMPMSQDISLFDDDDEIFDEDFNNLLEGLADKSESSKPKARVSLLQPKELDESSNELSFVANINKKVKQKGWTKLIGREQELKDLQDILLRRDKPNVVIIGAPGVGKTKIIDGLASLINKKKCNKSLNDYTIYELKLAELLSGTSYHGMIEQRMNNLFASLRKEKAILFIDEIHMLKTQNTSSDVSNLLKILLTDDVKIIGATTPEEYAISFEKDKALQRRFQELHLQEPSRDETLKIIKGISKNYESFHGVKYGSKIQNLIIDLSEKYIKSSAFPDKAIEVMDTIGANHHLMMADKYQIQASDVYNVVSKMVNIPKIQMETTEIEKLKNLENNMLKRIIGQDKAIKELVDGVLISKSGLRERNKIALSLFFKGPTGCGKTETIKVLAELLGIPLFRYDMSEYMEEHSVSKLIGSPPGYVGYQDGKAGSGLLISQIKHNPNCIILLDEIEKAHPRVLNLFLQVMDNGKITSSSGIEADCSNAYLFMTSNIGATVSHKMAHIGFGANSEESASDDYFNTSFSPEFRNRLDGAVNFNNLSKEVLNKITDNTLIELKNVLDNKKVKLKYDNDVIEYISGKAELENLGARPIKRIIHNEIKNVISKELVYGKLVKGGKLTISTENKKLSFKY